MSDWREGNFDHVWVYPNEDAYVMSDDYVVWAAVERGRPDYVPCWVLGYPLVTVAGDIRGPIEQDRVRRILGFGEL
jgi:hypothetical protein